MVESFVVLTVDGVPLLIDDIVSLSFTDRAGVKSDHLSVDLLPDKIRPKPSSKVTLTLSNSLGQVLECGLFHVQSVTRRNNKDLSFTATGVEFNEKQKKKRSQHYSKIKLSGIVNLVAKRLGHKVKFKAPDPKIDSFNQTEETDINFLHRLADKYDCLFSIKNDVVYFVDRADESLPVFAVDVSKAQTSDIKLSTKTEYKSCKASYYDSHKAKRLSVVYGKGKPQLEIKAKGKTKEEAKLEAKCALQKAQRGTVTGSIQTIGQTLYAGTRLALVNSYNHESDDIYSIECATHSWSRSSGWVVDIEFENFKLKEKGTK